MNTPSSPERYAKLILVPLIFASLWSPHAAGDTVTLDASRDNTIYEEDGSESSGNGTLLFTGDTGPTNNGLSRRALVFFDIVNGDGQNPGLPADATIDDVTLTISVVFARSGAQTTTIHKLTADWGEAKRDRRIREPWAVAEEETRKRMTPHGRTVFLILP